MTSAVLLLSCPDQRGLVAAVADFVLRHGGNVVHAEQHVDREAGVFFQRVEFDLDGGDLARDEVAPAFAEVARRFQMNVAVRFTDERPRIALLASKQPHCLADLLARWRADELPAEVVAVISNHEDHAALAHFSGAPFHYLPVTPPTKAQQERQILQVLAEADVELVVLARYMQVLGPPLLDAYPARIINIHHSFLPAFVGARPYHQAQTRGVKIIGATAHYASADLDEGPIIAQDVEAVSHRDSVSDLVRKGRDLETVVLARAVRAHLEHRTLVFGNKTIVFG
ncbi:formyltetrahydrofolate deformylase [Jatrophihabitans sp. GAS493]|uniref:formyltetrahydrofolate deformylase n=1 Tax=Jatrophihabitans sp. GAS493 TaxID=1907575 RepID=UPI000BB8F4CC|nr:formyltetrahydrofolate deformylase [Jatrophihabitans sp. GAS493]SOD72669.1 formyltetrahydrofolate deformylase [Jatrophihabitans sp. GAS493]